ATSRVQCCTWTADGRRSTAASSRRACDDNARRRRPVKTLSIALIAGDGIGPEVIDAALPCVTAAAATAGPRLESTAFPWGCDYYHTHGRMMPADALEQLRAFDAIYLGAVGRPDVPDHVSVHELILPIRQGFEQYINLRPMRLLPAVATPLAGRGARGLGMVCGREHSEGEYVSAGNRTGAGTAEDRAEQPG